jgi:SHS2 domain-containing protein
VYTIFPHTADAGLRVEAEDMEELFAEAGRAFFSLVVANLDDVQPRTQREITVEGDDLEYLFFDWLNELLFTFENERLLLSQFEVSLDAGGLRSVASGERVDRDRHQLEHEVKAITYHGLKVVRTEQGWMAEVIVDI